MLKAMGFPGRYLQGPGAISRLGDLLAELGCDKACIVMDAMVRESVWETAAAELGSARNKLSILDFPGECTARSIQELARRAKEQGADCIIGFGGGKTIDTAKGIARDCSARLVIAPTIASNDSPTSRLIVLYDDNHKVDSVQMLVRNPDMVLVDTDIVARAPARFFAAGLGDALSKKDEVEQCHLVGGHNFFGTSSTATARILAQHCYSTIVEYGPPALNQISQHHAPNDDVERVVEATVLLSGLAFESGGLSIAHALTRGFSAQASMVPYLHGEMVAFGSIVQLYAQQEHEARIRQHASLVCDLGLPVRFADFGGFQPTEAALQDIARLTSLAPYIGHITPAATKESLVKALTAADALGESLSVQRALG
ncbi:MAG TPA: glycerol dehydrogenase [Burkholderiaceae bacterium]|nr:glycerol dehydrogenase [Burkholderiaceae bacterium]